MVTCAFERSAGKPTVASKKNVLFLLALARENGTKGLADEKLSIRVTAATAVSVIYRAVDGVLKRRSDS